MSENSSVHAGDDRSGEAGKVEVDGSQQNDHLAKIESLNAETVDDEPPTGHRQIQQTRIDAQLLDPLKASGGKSYESE